MIRALLAAALAAALCAPAAAEARGYPCDFSVQGRTFPASYNGGERNNPDGTRYQGDALHHASRYPGLRSCYAPVVHPASLSPGLAAAASLLEDPASAAAFRRAAAAYCGGAPCAAGHADVLVRPGGPAASDEGVRFSASGWRVVCPPDGGPCSSTWVHRAARAAVPVADPGLEAPLHRRHLSDEDGYNATNADGTSYPWDPVVVLTAPSYRWQDERTATISVAIERDTRLLLEASAACAEAACAAELRLPGYAPASFEAPYGGDASAYNATGAHLLGAHQVRHTVRLVSAAGEPFASASGAAGALVVRHAPVYEAYPYLALGDLEPESWSNRHGAALAYAGSEGGGPGDAPGVHPGRRSKINGVEHEAWADHAGSQVRLSSPLHWAGARGQEPGEPGNCTGAAPPGPALESRAEGTAAFVRAGLGRVLLLLDASAEMLAGPHEAATVRANLTSLQFGGAGRTVLASYEYRYPDSRMGSAVSLEARDGAGPSPSAPVSIRAAPNLAMEGVWHVHDYLCAKAERDAGRADVGDVVVGDAYPRGAEASGRGGATLYLPRLAVWDAPHYGGLLALPAHEGLEAPAPYLLELEAAGASVSVERSYSHAANHSYVANVGRDLPLGLSPGRAGLALEAPEGFGSVRRVSVGGQERPGADYCGSRCLVPLPEGRAVVEAFNAWGGRAWAEYSPPPGPPADPPPAFPAAAAAAAAAAGALWAVLARLRRARALVS